MTATAEQPTTMTEQEIEEILSAIADGYGHLARSPILKTPADYGLEYEERSFPSMDGIPLVACR